MEMIDDVLLNFLLLKQKDEPLYEYVRKFKKAKEITELHIGGPTVFSKYIKTNSRFNKKYTKTIDDLKNEAWEEFAAYKLLKMQIHKNMVK